LNPDPVRLRLGIIAIQRDGHELNRLVDHYDIATITPELRSPICRLSSTSSSDNYHLLMWYASYSVTIAEDCEDGRTKRILKALAVDLTVEASRRLRERRAREGTINELLRATCDEA
jgi:hypothetical protein